MTHDSFALSEPLIKGFEQQHGVTLRILKSGEAGAMVNQAILSRERPLADVLYGVDTTFLSRALDADIFVPYDAPALPAIPAAYAVDPTRRVTPIDYGDVCVNYDKEALRATPPLPVPVTLEDLTKPESRGKLVVQNPATSSPGLAFLLATVARFGETGSYTWRDYWQALRANEVFVSSGWEDAYYTRFSGGSGTGDRPLVVSYASSPPVEVLFAEPQPAEAPTGVLTDGCFRQVEYAGVLRGARSETLARAFIDFLLSPAVQADIPSQMFVYPVVQGTPLPEVFVRHAAPVERPITLPPDEIGRNRERWIREWTSIVLR